MGFFRAALIWGGGGREGERENHPHAKICHTYTTMINDETWHGYTLLKEDSNHIYIYHVTHPADTSIFSPEIANFAISNAHIVCILINIVTILMMPGKIATPRPS